MVSASLFNITLTHLFPKTLEVLKYCGTPAQRRDYLHRQRLQLLLCSVSLSQTYFCQVSVEGLKQIRKSLTPAIFRRCRIFGEDAGEDAGEMDNKDVKMSVIQTGRSIGLDRTGGSFVFRLLRFVLVLILSF